MSSEEYFGGEVKLTKDQLDALEAVRDVVDAALVDLGRMYLREKQDRICHERSTVLRESAEAGARHALQQQAQVQETVVRATGATDGAWDLDLERGMLVRTDAKS